MQWLERTPLDSLDHFELAAGDRHSEIFVNVKSLRMVDIQVSDVKHGRRTRAGKKVTEITLSPATIEAIHHAIEELEAEKPVGRWKGEED